VISYGDFIGITLEIFINAHGQKHVYFHRKKG